MEEFESLSVGTKCKDVIPLTARSQEGVEGGSAQRGKDQKGSLSIGPPLERSQRRCLGNF